MIARFELDMNLLPLKACTFDVSGYHSTLVFEKGVERLDTDYVFFAQFTVSLNVHKESFDPAFNIDFTKMGTVAVFENDVACILGNILVLDIELEAVLVRCFLVYAFCRRSSHAVDFHLQLHHLFLLYQHVFCGVLTHQSFCEGEGNALLRCQTVVILL